MFLYKQQENKLLRYSCFTHLVKTFYSNLNFLEWYVCFISVIYLVEVETNFQYIFIEHVRTRSISVFM